MNPYQISILCDFASVPLLATLVGGLTSAIDHNSNLGAACAYASFVGVLALQALSFWVLA